MKSLLLSAASILKPPPIPNGQAQFQTVGTFQWTAPPGVYKVSLAMVGAGGGSLSNTSVNAHNGRGGNVRYINDIPVIPGQSYTIVVPPGGAAGSMSAIGAPATAFGYSSEDPLGGNIQGMDAAPALNSRSVGGGNAAGTLPAYNSYGFDIKTWKQYTTRQSNWNDPTVRPGNDFGGGGGCYNAGQSYPYYQSVGGKGAVRIIWGDGRSFPSNGIGDLT